MQPAEEEDPEVSTAVALLAVVQNEKDDGEDHPRADRSSQRLKNSSHVKFPSCSRTR